MAFKYRYKSQTQLLVRLLPYVAEEPSFALKGGTAINLFVQKMPRLPVNIDLAFLPVEGDWDTAGIEIEKSLGHVTEKVRSFDNRLKTTLSALKNAPANKLAIRSADKVHIKIESTPVLRGCVYPPEMKSIVSEAEELFGSAEINVVSFADLYAEKIVVALDRQHPSDLYDVLHLLENEGVDAKLRGAIIIYLISYHRSVPVVLDPKMRNISHSYTADFAGMTEEYIPILKLEEAREELVRTIVRDMPEAHKKFLISFYNREPEWQLLDIEGAEDLPAVKWKGLNLDKASEEVRGDLVSKLEEIF